MKQTKCGACGRLYEAERNDCAGCGKPYEDKQMADPAPVSGRNAETNFYLSPTLGFYMGMALSGSGVCIPYVPYDNYSGSAYSVYSQGTADDLHARGMERKPLSPAGEQGPISFRDKVAQMWREFRSTL